MFCDHSNLIYIFASDAELERHVPARRRQSHHPPNTPASNAIGAPSASESDGFALSDVLEVMEVQQKQIRELDALELVTSMIDGAVCAATKELLLRLFVVADCGSQGHRGVQSMVTSLTERFHIDKIVERVTRFVASFLHRKHIKGSKIIQRPWTPSILDCATGATITFWPRRTPSHTIASYSRVPRRRHPQQQTRSFSDTYAPAAPTF
ncbi:hypothetical protein PybrP1_010593 [[Pythium] brassicae (nom. inval.)]|nr:hypothetical protein PybrP1_010593 [[Pythium] brassicae (nom. inval.)]